MTLKSHAEYEDAKRRIRALGQLPEGTPGAETELNVLVELTTAWEAEHTQEAPDTTPAGRSSESPTPRD